MTLPAVKNCEICGNPKVDAHHDDYSRPRDVRWLCRAHHRQHHALHGPGKNHPAPRPDQSEMLSQLARSIVETRARLGETQTEFAKHFRVNQSTIARWEAKGIPDRGTPRIVVQMVLKSLELRPDFFGKDAQ